MRGRNQDKDKYIEQEIARILHEVRELRHEFEEFVKSLEEQKIDRNADIAIGNSL